MNMKNMKLAMTSLVFATMIALPVHAQDTSAAPASNTTGTMDTTRTDGSRPGSMSDNNSNAARTNDMGTTDVNRMGSDSSNTTNTTGTTGSTGRLSTSQSAADRSMVGDDRAGPSGMTVLALLLLAAAIAYFAMRSYRRKHPDGTTPRGTV